MTLKQGYIKKWLSNSISAQTPGIMSFNFSNFRVLLILQIGRLGIDENKVSIPFITLSSGHKHLIEDSVLAINNLFFRRTLRY